ncbi:MAG: type II toxin-antitoxin system RelE/ParE family toxin [Dehalococcoidia bacterium]|nr:type II toxin-antitoxin system RelE/ParE family toxin [Dehalococcoidia bacterium]
MDVFWTDPATANLIEIHRDLSGTSSTYADRTIERIMNRARQLAAFPRSGAVIPKIEALELRFLVERPYRIFYVVGPDHIDILAVLHSSREIF